MPKSNDPVARAVEAEREYVSGVYALLTEGPEKCATIRQCLEGSGPAVTAEGERHGTANCC
ncbi:hypothetical protein AB0E21_00620 [Streptomyces sp. NPDC047967]|uniref:hypothetical protein n=1 Tax=Streptomyces sp. NPDC047967 TaxID=3154924 RepID=UPI0033C83B0F